MPDLIAQGAEPQHRWRRPIPPDATHVIGRTAGPWAVPWDERVSRRHVEVRLAGHNVLVHVLDSARNPVFFRGRKTDDFELRPGEHFVIGGTTFTLADERVHVSLEMPLPEHERTFTVEELRRRPYQQPDQRIDVLSRLPDIISGSSSDSEMLVRLVNLLLSGVPRAAAAAIVAIGSPAAADLNPELRTLNPIAVLHWDRRILSGAEFRPSERLIRRAVETRESVAHLWSGERPRGGDYTLSEGVDWAFCVPVPGDACPGWSLYVTGSFDADAAAPSRGDSESLRDDIKFTELTAATLSALRESRLLAGRQAALAQFFSPVVMSALAGRDPDEALAPHEADVTVLFCDLRGFSRHSERHSGQLLELLHRVSDALGIMTRHILNEGGVVGDFHGDSAMGFWGWPLPQPDRAERACRAALAIRHEFGSRTRESSDDPASHQFSDDFQVGIGIASGRAVAGKIGTVDQVKVTVFGPVANLAARLEGLTKVLRVPILMDAATAQAVRARVPADVARVRRLARIKPPGMTTAVEVSELLPPAAAYPQLTDEHLSAFESAVAALDARDWAAALSLLHRVPPDDLAKDFLTVFIAQHNRTPPADWDGVVTLASGGV